MTSDTSNPAELHTLAQVREVKDKTTWPDFVAVCTCGWESDLASETRVAERYYNEHLTQALGYRTGNL